MDLATMADNEIKVLRRFVGRLMSPGRIPVWEQVDTETRFAMRSAYFLLNHDPGYDAESFVTVTLERLLQRISRVNEPMQVEYQGQVRGRIIWPATFKARYREDYDPSRYVCRQVRREYDTPENQLLKFMVERIYESLSAIPEVIRNGFSYFPVSAGAGSLPAADRIGRMESSVRNFHKHSRLRAVTLPANITEFHLLKAKMSPVEDYGEAADLYQSYSRCFLRSDWRHTARIARRVLPLPADLTTEGETWIELGAGLLLQALHHFTREVAERASDHNAGHRVEVSRFTVDDDQLRAMHDRDLRQFGRRVDDQ